ncbi:MAG: hypothetical protein AAF439_03660 [Pseudomonadota bacterium]
MILKFVVAAIVLTLIWMIAFRTARPGSRRRGSDGTPRPKPVKTEQLIKCNGCGIYLPAGQTCSCADRA